MRSFKKNVRNSSTKKAKETQIYHPQIFNKIILIVSQVFQIYWVNKTQELITIKYTWQVIKTKKMLMIGQFHQETAFEIINSTIQF